MRKQNRHSRTVTHLHRLLAGLLTIIMVLGLVASFGPVISARASDTVAVESSEEENTEVSNEAAAEENEGEELSADSSSDERTEGSADEAASDEKSEDEEAGSIEQTSAEDDTIDMQAKTLAEESDAKATGNTAVVDTARTEGGDISAADDQDTKQPDEKLTESVEKTFAEMTVEEQYEALLKMEEKERNEAVATLTEEQIQELIAYAESKAEPQKQDSPNTVVFTNAGPFMAPVSVVSKSARRLLKKAPLRAKSSDAPEGLKISKQATVNNDGTYTLTLESYTTGEVTSQEKSIPVDIVLVLDQSGSMKDPFGNTTRQNAMILAVKNFISSVKEKYSESADHRISLVTFGTDASTLSGWTFVDDSGKASLISKVEGLGNNPEGATNVQAGMESAQNLLTTGINYSGQNTNRKQVVVLFTDGVPTTRIDFNTDVADGAISAAKAIKDAGATVYSVGIFDGANPNQLHGEKFDYAGLGLFIHDVECTGSVGSCWGGTSAASFFGSSDVRDVDIPAGNRFLNYLSNNSNNATQIGIYWSDNLNPGNYLIHTRGHGWVIDKNASVKNEGYYLTAGNATDLDNAFQSIAENISTPTISLGTETVIKDIISPQFQLPENSTVKFYTQAYQGNDSWGTKTEITDGSVHTVTGTDSKNVSVTGFDFDENCVTEDEKQDGTHGKKLIIEITVKPDPNFLGGNIKTNDDDSGIVSNGETIANFTVEPVDIPLKKIEAQLTDKNIYLSTEDKLAEMFNKSDQKFTLYNADGTSGEAKFEDIFNGENNAAVNVSFQILDGDTVVESFVIPAGETSGTWSSSEAPVLTKDSYTIKCVITDAKNPNNKTVGTRTANINVFKPILTFEDKNVYYKGAQINVSAVTPTKVEWKHGNILDSDVTMHTAKPTLTYTYPGEFGNVVDQTSDYTVKVGSIGKEEDESYNFLSDATKASVSFLRNCAKEGLTDESATADEAFKIHVYTPSVEFADMEKYYGESISLTSPSANWNNSGVTMDNEEPIISIGITPASGAVNANGYVAVTDDFGVKAEIKVGNEDITQTLIDAGNVTRKCDVAGQNCGETPAVTTNQAFVVHVKSITLDVTKKIEGAFSDKTATYAFTVTVTPAQESGLSPITKKGTLGDNDKIEMDKLPKGATVTVTEADVPANYVVSATLNGSPVDVSGTGQGDTQNHTVTGSLTADDNQVVVINKLETIPVTGVDVPVVYLELLIAAGAALGIALIATARKKQKAKLN